MDCPQELKRRYKDGRVIPFVGAGASMSVKWESGGRSITGPSWEGLVDQASRLLGFETSALLRARGTDLQILEYFKLKHGDQIAKLTNWMARRLDPPDEVLRASPIHLALANLARCPLVYTTNYDNFIERAFNIHGRDVHVVALESQMGIEDTGCEIVKFHGDIDHPDQIVLTESDYERRLSLSTHMDHRLRADLLGRVLLFVGYSFRDPNISYLFRLFTSDYRDRPGSLAGARAFIAVPNPSDFEMRLFQARHIQVIPVREETITNDTAALLDSMRS